MRKTLHQLLLDTQFSIYYSCVHLHVLCKKNYRYCSIDFPSDSPPPRKNGPELVNRNIILVKYIPLRRNNPSQFIPIRKTVPVYNFCFDDSTTFPFKLPIFLSFFITIFGWHSNKPNDQSCYN